MALKNDASQAVVMLSTAQGLQGATEENQQQEGMSNVNGGYTDYGAKWGDLMKAFQAQTPPHECDVLANAYFRLLVDYSNFISQIQVGLQDKDLGKLMSLQGTAQQQVNTDATNSDTALAQVCTQYDLPKTFAIQPDSGGGGSILGM